MANRVFAMTRLVAMIAIATIWVACAGSGPSSAPSPVTLAVWDLEDVSVMEHGQMGMGELLAGRITARMQESQTCQVVERQQMVRAMEELHLGSSDLADPQTRLRLGQVIGAQQMVFGAFQVSGQSMRLDVRRVDVATGKILRTATAEGDSTDATAWFKAADQAAVELISK